MQIKPEVLSTDPTQSLISEMSRQSQGGPNVETPTAAMFAALLESDSIEIQNLVIDAADSAARRGIGYGPAVSGFRTSLIDFFRTKYEESGAEFNDEQLVQPEDWADPMHLLHEDLTLAVSKAFDSIRAGITFREAATPVKERYASVAAVTQLVKERFPHGVRGLSIGCSIMLGELQLRYSDEFPFSFENVAAQEGSNGAEIDLTEKANKLVGHAAIFKKVVGVDIFPIYDEARQRYDEDNAHFALSGWRPSERANPSYFRDARALMAKKQKGAPGYDPSPSVIFQQANLLDRDDFADFKDRFPEPFDVIMMNYVTQELPLADQVRLHEAASQLVSENGLLIYNHQAYIPNKYQKQPTPIKNVRHYKSYATMPYSSSMHIVDMLHPVRGVQEAMRYRDNRCQVVRLGAAKLMVNGSLEPISELFKNA